MPMLDVSDIYNIRYDAHDARNSYREVVLVYPNTTTGANYETFTDSPYDISADRSAYKSTTFTTYRAFARIKIIQDTTILGMNQVIPGLEVGDYLLYFRDKDQGQVERLFDNKDAYIMVDGNTLRPNNVTVNGVGKVFDVTIHCKKFSPTARATGL